MSNYRGHLLGGLGVYALAVVFLSLKGASFSTHMYLLSATLSGALFPDIDIKSKGQRLFLKILVLLLLFCLVMQAYIPFVMLLMIALFSCIIPHRGLFHNFGFIMILTALIALFMGYVVPAKAFIIFQMSSFFLAGVVSHLILDKGCKKAFH